MVQTLLARHPVMSTRDVDQARDEIGRRFCPHRLELTRRQGGLDLVLNAGDVGSDVGVNYLRYGDEVRIVPGTFDSFFLVQIPLHGEARVRVGERTVASNRRIGSIGSPTEPVDMVWSAGCEQLLVYLRREAVERVAGSAAAGSAGRPVVFDPVLDLNAPAVRDWLQLVRLAVDAVESGSGVLTSSLAAVSLQQTIIAALLGAQRNSVLGEVPGARLSSRTLRRATALLDGRPEHPWRVDELAREVGVGTRTLQDAFSRELGTTPLRHLKEIRLGRARADLLAADDSASVTDIAYRWGFYHLSRFASAYRAHYGELPSQTFARR